MRRLRLRRAWDLRDAASCPSRVRLSMSRRPSSAPTRSASPRRPEPLPLTSAPPRPSSRTSTTACPSRSCERHPAPSRLARTSRVRESLGDDEVGGGLDMWRKPSPSLVPRRESARGRPVSGPRPQPLVGEHGGVDPAGQLAQLAESAPVPLARSRREAQRPAVAVDARRAAAAPSRSRAGAVARRRADRAPTGAAPRPRSYDPGARLAQLASCARSSTCRRSFSSARRTAEPAASISAG